MAESMFLEFAESGCPIFRATSPLSRGRLKSKGHGKLSIHYSVDLETVETIFRTIVSANQLSLCGAVAETCEEYETLHVRSGQPVVGGQSSSSLVLSLMKTEVPLDSDDRARKDLLLQQIWRTNCKDFTTRHIEQFLYGCRVEIRIMSVNRDNSHSWVRISHGSNKFVNQFEQQRAGNYRSSARRLCVKIGCEGFCMPIKG